MKAITKRLPGILTAFVLLASLLTPFIQTPTPVSAAWLGTWENRIEFKIDKSRIDSDLTDFPILLHLSADTGVSGLDFTPVFDELTSDANRLKIAITAADGTTECYAEIKSWSDATETAWLFFKAPSVTSATYSNFFI